MKRSFLAGLMLLFVPVIAIATNPEIPTNQNAFLQWSWGKALVDVDGLQSVEICFNDSTGEIKEYINPKDSLVINGIQVNQIRYAFWKDKLYAVTIQTVGKKKHQALKKSVYSLINDVESKKSKGSQSVWFGPKTVAKITYDKSNHKGHLRLKSYDIDRKIQLIKFVPTKAYSSWIKYKRRLNRQ